MGGVVAGISRRSAGAVMAVAALLGAPAAAPAFDTGPHSDITRDALAAEGFGPTAQDVAVVNNWFVDLYSNSSNVPQSGHADTSVSVVGAFFENDEHWPQAVLDAANRMHFDASIWDVSDVAKAEAEWNRLQRATTQALRSIKAAGGANRELQVLSTIGIGLHALQDFYSHSNWIEQQGVKGVDGPDWSTMPYGLTPTWFDVPKAARDAPLNVYVGGSTGHKSRTHGAWNTEKNASMVKGMNKDWPGRPGYDNAYVAAYFATRQWVRAIHTALGDEALWQRVVHYDDRRGGELGHDLTGAAAIGRATGHWQGQGEPCHPALTLTLCTSRNGLGGDLIGARSAVNDYFEGRDRTRFRGIFQSLIPLFGQVDPHGDLLPIASTRAMQASTRFVRLRVTSMRGVGARALGDPLPGDRADMYTLATIAGQHFMSGEINGRDSFGFPAPYAPFEFLKAVPAGGRYAEPVRTMTVEIRTSAKAFAGTDDDVHLRLGPSLRFNLDKRLYDDFERGDRDTYSVPIDGAVAAGLTVGDITRVEIDKSPDGVGGGWRLRGVKLVVNGRTLYQRDGIERWLERGHRTWRADDFRATSPAGPALPITLDLWDEDSNAYGNDDHGDLNPFDMRRRLVLGYVPGTLDHDRATGGSVFGGRLGDGDKASVTYVVDTLTPTPAPLMLPPVVAPVEPTPAEPAPSPPPTTTTTSPTPPPAAPRPDLVISALGYDGSGYSFTVANRGAGDAGPFTVAIPGEGTWSFSGLAAGASATRTFRTTCREVTEQATADSLGQVDEADESNNSRSFTDGPCLT